MITAESERKNQLWREEGMKKRRAKEWLSFCCGRRRKQKVSTPYRIRTAATKRKPLSLLLFLLLLTGKGSQAIPFLFLSTEPIVKETGNVWLFSIGSQIFLKKRKSQLQTKKSLLPPDFTTHRSAVHMWSISHWVNCGTLMMQGLPTTPHFSVHGRKANLPWMLSYKWPSHSCGVDPQHLRK